MKKIFKKNQVIITALAIMIAVAGYINYSDTHLFRILPIRGRRKPQEQMEVWKRLTVWIMI